MGFKIIFYVILFANAENVLFMSPPHPHAGSHEFTVSGIGRHLVENHNVTRIVFRQRNLTDAIDVLHTM